MDSILSILVSHEFLAKTFAAVIALVGLLHIGVFLVGEVVDSYKKITELFRRPPPAAG